MIPAERIRERAESMGYWDMDDTGKRLIRAHLRHDFPSYTRQAIELALKRGSKPGKPKHPRCAACGQRMPKETP